MRIATLKDAGRFAPDVHIFTRSKLPCDQIVLLENSADKGASPRGGATKEKTREKAVGRTLPRGATTKKPAGVFSVYYDMQKEWPAASLKRREACLAKMK